MSIQRIIIEGMPHAPSWEALEHVVQTAISGDVPQRRRRAFRSIHREDDGSNYRAHGIYKIGLWDGTSVILDVRP